MSDLVTEQIMWIPIEVRMPNPFIGVLLSNDQDPFTVFGMWNDLESFWARPDDPSKQINLFKPTHWANLPLGVNACEKYQKVSRDD